MYTFPDLFDWLFGKTLPGLLVVIQNSRRGKWVINKRAFLCQGLADDEDRIFRFDLVGFLLALIRFLLVALRLIF